MSHPRQCGICIIGAGFAGLCAAVAAAELHADVLVIEANAFAGGNTLVSEGIINAYDPVRQDALSLADSPQKFLDDTMRFGSGQNQPDLAARLCYESFSALTWLAGHGLRFQPRLASGPGLTTPRGHLSADRRGGSAYIAALKAEAERLGVRFLFETRVTDFSLSENGCRVSCRTGTAAFGISARTLVIASGGFAGNRRLLERFAPRSVYAVVPPCASDGTVMQSAVNLGAQVIADNFVQFEIVFPNGRDVVLRHALPAAFSNPARFIAVNASGRRFVREDVPTEELLLQGLAAPDGRFILIADADERFAVTPSAPVKTFASADELADAFGMDREILRQTFENRSDPALLADDIGPEVRRPAHLPFPLRGGKLQAVEARVMISATLGGLMINTAAQVLDRAGRVMPNLYCAGEAAGGLHGRMALRGNLLAGAAVFGITAGRNAARAAAFATPQTF